MVVRKPSLLIVAHGSRSPRWVGAQRDWFDGVRRALGEFGDEAELCFLEISLPLFEDRLMALSGVITEEEPLAIMPFFLAKGGHAGEDVPEIANSVLGERRWRLVSPEGWHALLARNAERRLAASGARPGDAVVVSGYGSAHDPAEWDALVAAIRSHAGAYGGDKVWHFAPSGHFLSDYGAPLRDALRAVAASGARRVAILPLYLAVSTYQESLIPEVMAEFPELEFLFEPTSILPDPELEQWAAGLISRAIGRTPEANA